MRNENVDNKISKSALICKKENAISSLYEVEHFLCNLKRLFNAFSLYKILK